MDVILPFRIKNEKKFFECAFKLGFDEMSAQKFFYITQLSDLDIYPRMGDERLSIVLYCWEMCEDYKLKLGQDEWELPEELEAMLKLLVPWSLDIWFSKEWDRCKLLLKHTLIHCLNRARGLLMRLPDMMQINWDFLLLYNLTPWQVTYLKALTVTKEKTLENGALTIETEEQLAASEDISYIKLEQLPLIVLRLVKLFDQSSIDMVKTLCMRVIAAWNKVYSTEMETGGTRLPYVLPEDKRCLLLICHIYLMAVYETDDVKGYVIDNMVNNIRFYYQGFQTSYAVDNMKYTPARFIALTCIHLRLQKREFFDFFIWNSFDTSQVNLFGVVSQAYKSYLLGNLLMELNHMNEEDFAANVALYKRLMNAYVNEREKSEIFIANELLKLEAQHYAHNIIQCVPNMTNYKSKICKGNRMSNIGNYENTDDDNCETTGNVGDIEEEGVDKKKGDLRVDPIFQNIPNNQDILYYVYDVLSKKSYNGWHFAKIVLLFKIISHELNMIETWRYHPGLTINFMLNLETKLSQHYTDLAKIFKDHPFIEQECWLTAFYLNPTSYNYEAIKRLGIRNNRKRSDDQGRWVTGKDKIDAKYGLLSSTIDVKEITMLSNTEQQNRDYEPLFQALCSLHLPDSMVKDILTVVFLARNKSFSWAVDWGDLRRRCKMLMSNSSEKKRFVELNMAEANDRLKFLKIDYDKYKNRPQLDYGSIEQGYETLINSADMDDDSEEESEEEDFEDDEDVYETQRGRGNKKPTETIEDDNSQEDDPYLTGKRRTRARAAAAMASLLFTSDLSSRRKRRKKDEEEPSKENEDGIIDGEEKSNDSKCTEPVDSLTPSAMEEDKIPDIPKKNIKECLRERPLYANPTHGFQPLIDMWSIEKSDLETIDSNCVSLMESSSVLHRFAKLKNINKEINPNATNDVEQIDMDIFVLQESPAEVNNEKKIYEPVSELPINEIFIKDEPTETEVPAEIEKPVDSQDIEQTSQDKNIDQVNSSTYEPQNTEDASETNVDDHKSKSNSGKNDISEVTNTNSDKQKTHAVEINTKGSDNDTSIANEGNGKNMDDQQERNTTAINDPKLCNQNEDTVIAGTQGSDAMKINFEKEAMSEETKINKSTTIADELQLTAMEVTDEEEKCKEMSKEKEDSAVTIAGNQQTNEIIAEEEKDKELIEKNENEVTTPIVVKPNSNTMDINVEPEQGSKLSEPNDEKEDSIMADLPKVTAVAKAINDSNETDNKIPDESNKNQDSNPPIALKLESDNDEIISEETLDKISKSTVESKTGPVPGTGDANESKTTDDTSAVNEEPKSLIASEGSKENVTESLDVKGMDTDGHTITEYTEIKANQTSSDKCTEYTETIEEHNDDKSNVIFDEEMETKTTDATEATIDDPHINAHGSDMPLLDSEESNSVDGKEETDSDLKKLCLTKPLKVLIRRLRPSELVNLRQPKVRLKRIKNVEVFLEQTRAKRRSFLKRKLYIDESSDTSLMSNSSSSDAYRPPKSKTKAPIKRHIMRQTRTSDSDCDSIKSNIQNRRLSTPNASSNQSNNTSRSSSRPSAGNLVVTPRSASGLKLRISHADQKSQILQGKSNLSSVDEIIQLSSSSNDSNTMDSIVEVTEIADPLFEEEMVI